MIFKKWEVENYKSIGDPQTAHLDGLNVLLGENNTGKSSVVDAVRDFRKAFPRANDVDSDWVNKRITRKNDVSELKFRYTFELTDAERQQFFDLLIEDDRISDRQTNTWHDDDFREIRIELYLSPSSSGPIDLSGQFNIYSDFDGSNVAIREGELVEEGTDYLDFNKLDSIEYNTGKSVVKRGFASLLEIIKDSINSWQFVDAFREPEPLRDAVEEMGLEPGGDNLSQVLLTLVANNDERFRIISETYSDVMEGVDEMRAPLRGNKTTVEIVENEFDGPFDLSEISAGSKEILTLITQIVLAGSGCDVILIEEPELHLHPGAQRDIFNKIQSELNGKTGPQVIISTHSAEYVDHERVDNIFSVKRDGLTTISKTSESEINSDLKELGYRYSGMLQSDAVVLVEGTTDKTMLRALAAEKYNFDLEEHRIGLADLENSAQLIKHSRSLVKILSVFSIPYLFICDSDVSEDLNQITPNGETIRDELPPDAIEGKIMDYINRGDKDIWWDPAKKDDIHVWKEEEEIEGYLFADRGTIKEHYSLIDDDEIEELLETDRFDGPEERLEAISNKKKEHIDPEARSFSKPSEIHDLACKVDISEFPGEFHDVMEDIASLIDEGHQIEKPNSHE